MLKKDCRFSQHFTLLHIFTHFKLFWNYRSIIFRSCDLPVCESFKWELWPSQHVATYSWWLWSVTWRWCVSQHLAWRCSSSISTTVSVLQAAVPLKKTQPHFSIIYKMYKWHLTRKAIIITQCYQCISISVHILFQYDLMTITSLTSRAEFWWAEIENEMRRIRSTD